MASMLARQSLALALVVAAVSDPAGCASSSKLLNITNNCEHTVWPEISSAASSAAPNTTTGFELEPGQWEVVSVSSEWSGRVWGRNLCNSSTTDDGSSGNFTCVTGGGGGGPVTVAEFTLHGSGGMDLYDVSLVDGFNLPVMVAPQPQGPAAGGNCAPTGCMVDMNGVGACPPELRVTSSGSGTGGGGGAVVGCKSACQAFGSAGYCCTGEYGTPDTCKPSAYSELFKKACPLAFSYAYDDGADSIFTCGGGDTTYAISFCPSTTSGKLSSSPNSQAPPPGTGNLLPHIIDGITPTPYTGGSQVVGAATPPWRITLAIAVLGLVAAVLGLVTGALGAVAKFWDVFNNHQAGAGAGSIEMN